MATRSEYVNVEPKVIEKYISFVLGQRVSLREGLNALKFREKDVRLLMDGKATVKLLKKLAKELGIPLTKLLNRDHERVERALPKVFRKTRDGKLAKKTRTAYVRACQVRAIYKYALQSLGFDARVKLFRATLNDDPKATAVELRQLFALTEELQVDGFRRAGDFFDWLRNKLLERNILVFVLEMERGINGVSLTDDVPFVVLVNSSDSEGRRLFTLAHELGHVLLRNHVFESVDVVGQKEREEQWCNEFASSFLIPPDLWERYCDLDDSTMAKKFKVSSTMVKYKKLKDSGKLDEFEQVVWDENKRRKGNGGPPQYIRKISGFGRITLQRLFYAEKKGVIRGEELARPLGVKKDTLEKLREAVVGEG